MSPTTKYMLHKNMGFMFPAPLLGGSRRDPKGQDLVFGSPCSKQ